MTTLRNVALLLFAFFALGFLIVDRISSITAKTVHQKSVETLRAAAGRACDFVVSRVRQIPG